MIILETPKDDIIYTDRENNKQVYCVAPEEQKKIDEARKKFPKETDRIPDDYKVRVHPIEITNTGNGRLNGKKSRISVEIPINRLEAEVVLEIKEG